MALAVAGALSVTGLSTLTGRVGVGAAPHASKAFRVTGTAEITGQFDVSDDFHVEDAETSVDSDQFTVNSTITELLSPTLRIKEDIPILNYGQAGSPSNLLAGIRVDMGSLTDKMLVYNQNADQWESGDPTTK